MSRQMISNVGIGVLAVSTLALAALLQPALAEPNTPSSLGARIASAPAEAAIEAIRQPDASPGIPVGITTRASDAIDTVTRDTGPDWLVAIIQAALAEKRCYKGPIDGNWTDATRSAAGQLVKLASVRATTDVPSEDLLLGIRASEGKTCATPAAISAREPVVPPAVKRQAPEASVSRPRKEAPPAREAPSKPSRSASTPKESSSRSASHSQSSSSSGSSRQASSSPGPAVFSRPVGVGRF